MNARVGPRDEPQRPRFVLESFEAIAGGSRCTAKPDVATSIRKLPVPRMETKEARPLELGPDRVGSPPAPVPEPPQPAEPVRRVVVQPLAPARYKIQFTASAELHDKLERLQALMRSSVPDGDLATIIEEAVTEKLERIEAKRFAKTKAPRKRLEDADTAPSSRYIPAPVRRAVWERDSGRCTFVDGHGRRCTECDNLEFHHNDPFARGGDHRPENIRLTCRTHNVYLAERDYGKEVMGRYRRSGSMAREPSPVYYMSDRAALARPPTPG